jgi:MFS family permease
LALAIPGALRSRLGNAGRILTALRYPQYRRFWLGNFGAVTGQQMMWVAQGWLVYDLTGSPVYLGYAGLVTALPAIGLNLLGGVLADRLDQRRVITATQVMTSAAVFILATLTALDLVHVWHVLVVAFILGATQAFNNPARQAIFPQLIDKKDLMNAVSLNSMVWQSTRVIAPAIAGVIVSVAGSAVAFYVCSVCFLALAVAVLGLKIERTETRQRRASVLRDLSDGLGFIRDNFLFTFLISMSFFSSFFGGAGIQLMPVFVRDILDAGPSALGVLMSVMGVGTMIGVITGGYLGDFERKGLLIIGGATLYGTFLVLFANSTYYPLSLALIFCMGICLQLYTITLQTTLQMRVPDELRGRVMGVYGMTHNIGPLGAMQAGLLASAFGAPTAVTISGLAIIAFSLLVASSRGEVRRLSLAPST